MDIDGKITIKPFSRNILEHFLAGGFRFFRISNGKSLGTEHHLFKAASLVSSSTVTVSIRANLSCNALATDSRSKHDFKNQMSLLFFLADSNPVLLHRLARSPTGTAAGLPSSCRCSSTPSATSPAFLVTQKFSMVALHRGSICASHLAGQGSNPVSPVIFFIFCDQYRD